MIMNLVLIVVMIIVVGMVEYWKVLFNRAYVNNEATYTIGELYDFAKDIDTRGRNVFSACVLFGISTIATFVVSIIEIRKMMAAGELKFIYIAIFALLFILFVRTIFVMGKVWMAYITLHKNLTDIYPRAWYAAKEKFNDIERVSVTVETFTINIVAKKEVTPDAN